MGNFVVDILYKIRMGESFKDATLSRLEPKKLLNGIASIGTRVKATIGIKSIPQSEIPSPSWFSRPIAGGKHTNSDFLTGIGIILAGAGALKLIIGGKKVYMSDVGEKEYFVLEALQKLGTATTDEISAEVPATIGQIQVFRAVKNLYERGALIREIRMTGSPTKQQYEYSIGDLNVGDIVMDSYFEKRDQFNAKSAASKNYHQQRKDRLKHKFLDAVREQGEIRASDATEAKFGRGIKTAITELKRSGAIKIVTRKNQTFYQIIGDN